MKTVNAIASFLVIYLLNQHSFCQVNGEKPVLLDYKQLTADGKVLVTNGSETVSIDKLGDLVVSKELSVTFDFSDNSAAKLAGSEIEKDFKLFMYRSTDVLTDNFDESGNSYIVATSSFKVIENRAVFTFALENEFYSRLDSDRKNKVFGRFQAPNLDLKRFTIKDDKLSELLDEVSEWKISLMKTTDPKNEVNLSYSEEYKIATYEYDLYVKKPDLSTFRCDVIVLIDNAKQSYTSVSDKVFELIDLSLLIDKSKNKQFSVTVEWKSEGNDRVLFAKSVSIYKDDRLIASDDFDVIIDGIDKAAKPYRWDNPSKPILFKQNKVSVTKPDGLKFAVYAFSTSPMISYNLGDFKDSNIKKLVYEKAIKDLSQVSFSIGDLLDRKTVVGKEMLDLIDAGETVFLIFGLQDNNGFLNQLREQSLLQVEVKNKLLFEDKRKLIFDLQSQSNSDVKPIKPAEFNRIQFNPTRKYFIDNTLVEGSRINVIIERNSWKFRTSQGGERAELLFDEKKGGWELKDIQAGKKVTVDLFNKNDQVLKSWSLIFLEEPNTEAISLIATKKNDETSSLGGYSGIQEAKNHRITFSFDSTFDLKPTNSSDVIDMSNYSFVLRHIPTSSEIINEGSYQEFLKKLNGDGFRREWEDYEIVCTNKIAPQIVLYYYFRFRNSSGYLNLSVENLSANYIFSSDLNSNDSKRNSAFTSFSWNFVLVPLKPKLRLVQDMLFQPGLEVTLPYSVDQIDNGTTEKKVQSFAIGLRNTVLMGAITFSYGYTYGDIRKGSYFNIGIDPIIIARGDVKKLFKLSYYSY
jgi:hypothetical protein